MVSRAKSSFLSLHTASFALAMSLVVAGAACGPGDESGPVWEETLPFDPDSFYSGVWGSAPDDVWIVGGNSDEGEIFHYDGSEWTSEVFADEKLLIWVFGFGPSDVYAVGLGGSALHYDGASWSPVDFGTSEQLWGIWGAAPDDIWVVGGDVSGGAPELIHYDGQTATPYALPEEENPFGANALFKVWGYGSRIVAVGQQGLILEYDGTDWKRVPSGNAAQEYNSLWGLSEDEIYLVGGNNGAGRYAYRDGDRYETLEGAVGVEHLASAFADDDGIFVGSRGGVVYEVDPQTRELGAGELVYPNNAQVHSMWGDGAGTLYGVGGQLIEGLYYGIAYQRKEK